MHRRSPDLVTTRILDDLVLYGSVLSQGASELIQHDLLAFADLDRAEAHESAFLRSVGSRLRRHDEPTAEGLGFIRCCLLGDDPGDSTKFVEDLGAGRCCARWLEVLRRVLLLIHHRLDVEGHRGEQLFLAGGTVGRSVAIISFEISIGPPGSAIVIAIPATKGARSTRCHSSSVNDAFDVMDPPSIAKMEAIPTGPGEAGACLEALSVLPRADVVAQREDVAGRAAGRK